MSVALETLAEEPAHDLDDVGTFEAGQAIGERQLHKFTDRELGLAVLRAVRALRGLNIVGADLVALAAPIRPHLGDRFRAWYLERIALASRVPVILLPLPSDSEPVSAASISGDTRRAPWYSRRRPHETQRRADLDHPHGEPAAPR